MPFYKGLLALILGVALLTPLKLQSTYALLAESTKAAPSTVDLSQLPTVNQTVGDQFILGTEVSASPSATPSATPVATKKIAVKPVAPKPAGLASDILSALNSYRQKRGRAPLVLDSKLASFAKSRAESLSALGRLDNHSGFQSFINSGGFQKLGFKSLGENQSWASAMPSATYLIETQYASDKPHDDNQINPGWQYVGIGVSGNFTDLVFGSR